MEKLSKKQAEALKKRMRILSDKNFMPYVEVIALDCVNSGIDSMTEQEPEKEQEYIRIDQYKEIDGVPLRLLRYVSDEEGSRLEGSIDEIHWIVLDEFKKKTPEEELAGFKCPVCGYFIDVRRIDGTGGEWCEVFCINLECNWKHHSGFQDPACALNVIENMACYQPDWNGGREEKE